ncbi:MAG: hypothetical protein AAB350_01370 [Patescibacteria group bacterium]
MAEENNDVVVEGVTPVEEGTEGVVPVVPAEEVPAAPAEGSDEVVA